MKRIRYRDKSGKIKHHTIVNFSELDKEMPNGDIIPFDGEGDNVFESKRDPLPKFWGEIYSKLSGMEAVVVLCLFQWEMTQEEVSHYFGFSQGYINKVFKEAIRKLEKHKELLELFTSERG